jgi:hypothetical protein
MKTKAPTTQQLVDIIREYNVARAHELSQKPATGFAPEYKNPLMENLYDAANMAATTLAQLKVDEISVAPRK